MTKGARLFELIKKSVDRSCIADNHQIIEIASMIDRIERAIGHSLQHHAARCHLTLLEAQSLAAILDLDEKAKLSAIAETVRMPLSTMTGVAARLERSGLVARTRATDDARASVLTLTEDGKTRLVSMFGPLFEQISKLTEQTGSDTLQSVIVAFHTVSELAENLESLARESSES